MWGERERGGGRLKDVGDLDNHCVDRSINAIEEGSNPLMSHHEQRTLWRKCQSNAGGGGLTGPTSPLFFCS